MRHAAITVASALLVALSCSSAMAQWKWRDASGRITASDLPPPSSIAERDILARPSDRQRLASTPSPALTASVAPAASGSAAAAGTDPELEARRKRAANEQNLQQRQLQARDDAARAENCVRAKAYLAALNDGKRVIRPNAQGEREFVDDKGRADEIQRARAVMASDCK